MTNDQFEAAKELSREKYKIETELDIWERKLTKTWNLAVSDHFSAVRLGSNIPESLFQGFRQSAINALKVRLKEIEDAFAAI